MGHRYFIQLQSHPEAAPAPAPFHERGASLRVPPFTNPFVVSLDAGSPGEMLNSGDRSWVLGLVASYLRALSMIPYPSGSPDERPVSGERSVAFGLVGSNLRSLSTILYDGRHRHRQCVRKVVKAHPRMTSAVVIRLARRFD